MNYKLHYAPLDLNGQDIQELNFEDTLELTAFVMSGTSTDEVVFLISIGDEVIVTESILFVLKYLQGELYHKPIFDNTLRDLQKEFDDLLNEVTKTTNIDIFLQEYSTYEEAYKVALEMREQSPLCYK